MLCFGGVTGAMRKGVGRRDEQEGQRRLTEAGDGGEEGQEDHPVVSPPDDPAAVEQDEVAKKVAEGDEDVGADELRRLVRIAFCPRVALCRSFSFGPQDQRLSRRRTRVVTK